MFLAARCCSYDIYQQGQTEPTALAEKPSASFEETPAFD